MNENTLHTWIGKYGPQSASEADKEPMYEELKRLRQETQRLRQERDILKKAATGCGPATLPVTAGEVRLDRRESEGVSVSGDV